MPEPHKTHRHRRLRTAAPLAAALLLSAPWVAEAGGYQPGSAPASTVRYPTGSSATWTKVQAFDTCRAPSTQAMAAWKSSSPYGAVGVYIGGQNWACENYPTNSSWVRTVSAQGWRILPIYVGLQAPCASKRGMASVDPSKAAAQGAAEARTAVSKAKALHILPGSAIYADMEHYGNDSACRTAVLRFLSGWTKQLHDLGYLSGVYSSASAGIDDLDSVYGSTHYSRPDAIWIARWDGKASVWNEPYTPNWRWAVHQRVKQYRGDHYHTYGGHRILVDDNVLDAPVATVPYRYRVTARTALNMRSGPSTAYAATGTLASGAGIDVLCQSLGQQIGTTRVWNRLTNGSWVSDHYTSTPSKTSFSAPLPRCSYPYQVTAGSGLRARTGPGTNYSAKGTLPYGALAYVVCQRYGSKIGSTRIWNQLVDGRWVADYYVATPSSTSYSSPIPRC